MLPIHLIKFWYPEAIAFFVTTWKNLMLFLEEDLAVGLMVKLLFVPLFHDSSIVGKALSLLFRIGRIIVGMFAFCIATILLFLIAGYWFCLPILAVLNKPEFFSRGFFLAGLGLFIIHIVTHPHKKVWQIKNQADLWLCSNFKKINLSFAKLLADRGVRLLLSNLELELSHVPNLEIKDPNEVANDAFKLAKSCGSQYLQASNFFVAAIKLLPNIDQFLLKFDLKPADFDEALLYLEKKNNRWRRVAFISLIREAGRDSVKVRRGWQTGWWRLRGEGRRACGARW